VNADRSSVMRVSEQYDVPSSGLGARVEVRPRVGPLELRLGGDWRGVEGETRELYSFQNGAGTRRRLAGGESHTFGTFAEAGWDNAAWTVSAGGRIDRWLIRDGSLRESLVATGEALNAVAHPDRSGWQPTGRGGIAWRGSEVLTMRAATYLGWRLPTLNELYRPFRVGNDSTQANSDLEPERLRGAELGVEYRPASALRFGATLSANSLSDAIANVTLSESPAGTIRQRQNLDAIRTAGIELDASLDLGSWSLAAGYSYTDAKVEGRGPALALDGLRPAQTPRHSLAASARWQGAGGARASMTARYAGAQFEDDLNQQLLPDALTFDAAGAYPIASGVQLQARAENILDERIVAGVSGTGLIERATPRTLWIGVRFGG
jgi:outer membrane receptor protein involved in Fe transport